MSMSTANYTHSGSVTFVSAGPGDPELITLKAVKYLQRAEVIITDRLVSEEILSRFAASGAEVIRVGKQGGNTSSTPQAVTNELLVYHGRARNVVRLKGGDVSVFSNILDELLALQQHGIPYEIVPGVTAAIGAAAYAGIPLTARGFSAGVRFLTGHDLAQVDESRLREWATTTDTLVFYMSVDTLPVLVQSLTRNGIASSRKLAVIEQATTPRQQVHILDLYTDQDTIAQQSFVSPSLVIIGTVVSLHEHFHWFNPAHVGKASYFTSVTANNLEYAGIF